jgi:hypothetical protein
MAPGLLPLAVLALATGAPDAAPAAAAPVTGWPRAVLIIENAERGRTLRIPLRRGEPFAVVSRHSIYDQPVTEEFVIDADARIVLAAVSSPSAAVREYFGLTRPGERHPLHRVMREIVFRVAAGEPQRLRAAGVERSFLELGEHGDRLVMRACLAGSGRNRR